MVRGAAIAASRVALDEVSAAAAVSATAAEARGQVLAGCDRQEGWGRESLNLKKFPPNLIATSVKAKGILAASEFKPDAEALSTVTALHALRLVGSCLMIVSGVTEYTFGLRAAVAASRKQKAA